jgi:hypothetical protein
MHFSCAPGLDRGSPMESALMFVFLLPKRGQTFAGMLPNTPGMFAWGFAIF